ncbi:MAG: hypothetical protein F6J93_12625 [Oscillatoria sp. SIO1A7]|nr:hypothetical protein [Oscillatoria sp. SIO1A7]
MLRPETYATDRGFGGNWRSLLPGTGFFDVVGRWVAWVSGAKHSSITVFSYKPQLSRECYRPYLLRRSICPTKT